MKSHRMTALAVLAGALPVAALAQDLHYTFAEISYVNTELDPRNVDGDGFELRGSFGVTDIVHVFGAYQDIGFDSNIDASALVIGAGLNWSLAPRADFIADVGYVNTEIETPIGDFDDDGFQLGAGVRGRLPDLPVELEGRVNYVDLDDSGDDTTFRAQGRYYFTDLFAVGGGAEFSDDATTWNIGFRAEFPGR